MKKRKIKGCLMYPRIIFSLLLGLFLFAGSAIAVEPALSPEVQQRQQLDHQALRDLLNSAKNDLNTNNLAHLKLSLASDFQAINMDGQRFNNFSDFEKYWQGLFNGKDAPLKKIDVNPSADELTEFLSDNIGYVQGVSKDTYEFKDGDIRQMTSDWSAIVKKENGVWKLSKIHFSVNLFNNPYLEGVKRCLYWIAAAAGILGLILGIVIGMFIKRRKKAF